MHEEIIENIVFLAEEISKEEDNHTRAARLYAVQRKIDAAIGKRMAEMNEEDNQGC